MRIGASKGVWSTKGPPQDYLRGYFHSPPEGTHFAAVTAEVILGRVLSRIMSPHAFGRRSLSWRLCPGTQIGETDDV